MNTLFLTLDSIFLLLRRNYFDEYFFLTLNIIALVLRRNYFDEHFVSNFGHYSSCVKKELF